MKLENQVTSLDISKRLKELGVKQESYFWWSWYNNAEAKFWEVIRGRGNEAEYSAFTAAELDDILFNLPDMSVSICKRSKKIEVRATSIPRGIGAAVLPPIYLEKDEHLADARGKMLIYLLEQGLIKP